MGFDQNTFEEGYMRFPIFVFDDCRPYRKRYLFVKITSTILLVYGNGIKKKNDFLTGLFYYWYRSTRQAVGVDFKDFSMYTYTIMLRAPGKAVNFATHCHILSWRLVFDVHAVSRNVNAIKKKKNNKKLSRTPGQRNATVTMGVRPYRTAADGIVPHVKYVACPGSTTACNILYYRSVEISDARTSHNNYNGRGIMLNNNTITILLLLL